MSKISEYLNKIKTAIYGREVRDAIHDSIKECYADVTSGATLANAASDKANAATEKANTAASNADNRAALADKATTGANNAANLANTAATTADDKAALADNAAGLIRRMDVSTTHLPPGSAPTSSLHTVEDASGLSHYSLVLGIPTGNTGATPALTFEVSTGEAGTSATVEVTGTAEAPIVHLTIPKGATGKIENLVINGKPVDSGTITLTASDIGALPADTAIPTKTSDLTNDSGFITADNVPVQSVNGKTGVVSLSAEDVGALSGTDATLAIAGKAADAKITGDLINQLKAEKANESIVSDAWQSGKTYAVGAYCIYNDTLYKASVQTTAEPGNSSDWVQCNVTNELVAQGDTLNNACIKEYFNGRLDKTRPVTYPVVSVAGYLVIAYNYASAAIFLVRGEGTGGYVLRIAPANDRNVISCVWRNAQLNITSTDEATGIVCIIRLY